MWREKCRRTQETTAPMIAGVVWYRVLRGCGCGGCGESSAGVEAGFGVQGLLVVE
jgi:hypothetical protein